MELQRVHRGGLLRRKQGGLAHAARGRSWQGGIPSPPRLPLWAGYHTQIFPGILKKGALHE